jgi:hypothetical protein
MGLWASHGCWDAGAYGAFLRWRHELARAAGYKIRDPSDDERAQGFYSPLVDIDWEMFEEKNYQGEWDSPPGDDPLLFLIVHSDCDGVIHPAQGVHIARRLEQLVPLLDESQSGGHIASMRDRTERFIAGLRAAAAAHEDVEFG